MSRVTYSSEDVIVYDDVLSETDFTRLFAYLNTVESTCQWSSSISAS